ncbi:hypothetical protein DsansV1_C49g0244011 [Dioscorea sansibarensis]
MCCCQPDSKRSLAPLRSVLLPRPVQIYIRCVLSSKVFHNVWKNQLTHILGASRILYPFGSSPPGRITCYVESRRDCNLSEDKTSRI